MFSSCVLRLRLAFAVASGCTNVRKCPRVPAGAPVWVHEHLQDCGDNDDAESRATSTCGGRRVCGERLILNIVEPQQLWSLVSYIRKGYGTSEGSPACPSRSRLGTRRRARDEHDEELAHQHHALPVETGAWWHRAGIEGLATVTHSARPISAPGLKGLIAPCRSISTCRSSRRR